MTNESRAEVGATLDGRTWTMRPTFQTLRGIEHKTGMSALELVRVIANVVTRVEDGAEARHAVGEA